MCVCTWARERARVSLYRCVQVRACGTHRCGCICDVGPPWTVSPTRTGFLLSVIQCFPGAQPGVWHIVGASYISVSGTQITRSRCSFFQYNPQI